MGKEERKRKRKNRRERREKEEIEKTGERRAWGRQYIMLVLYVIHLCREHNIYL